MCITSINLVLHNIGPFFNFMACSKHILEFVDEVFKFSFCPSSRLIEAEETSLLNSSGNFSTLGFYSGCRIIEETGVHFPRQVPFFKVVEWWLMFITLTGSTSFIRIVQQLPDQPGYHGILVRTASPFLFLSCQLQLLAISPRCIMSSVSTTRTVSSLDWCIISSFSTSRILR